jgi:hypothetical protein
MEEIIFCLQGVVFFFLALTNWPSGYPGSPFQIDYFEENGDQ